ncbi:MAG: hypothetical protein EA426_15845 [Spirochaetaceae bacterium]|nr:MAG: hypothetical protein EA426_15845 [Spirochaetaceae bacterium]
MGIPRPDQTIIALIGRMRRVDAQNILLRVPDTEFAVALLHMNDDVRDYVLNLAGAAKAERVRQVIERHRHTRISYESYLAAAERMIRRLSTESAASATPSDAIQRRSYYRPGRARR